MKLATLSFLAVALALVVIFAAPRFLEDVREVEFGSATLDVRAIDSAVTLLNATGSPTAGRYDSLDLPRGTEFVTSSSSPVIFTGITHTNTITGSVTIELGYGRDRVTNSVAAPTDSVVLGRFTFPAESDAITIPVFLEVPRRRVPYVKLDGASWSSDVVAIGLIR